MARSLRELWKNWFAHLPHDTQDLGRRARRRARRVRPVVEELETRCVPTITTNMDFATVTAGVLYQGASVLANDVDSEGLQLWAMPGTDPSHGTLSINSDGTYTYTADRLYSGQDRFLYRAYNGRETVDGEVAITVQAAPNHDPVGNADSYSVQCDQSLYIGAPGVLGNDTDQDNDPLTVSGYWPSTNGSVTVYSDGSFFYAPNPGFVGSDTFSYAVTDGIASDTATVTITVTGSVGGNHPPQGSADSYSVNAGQTLTVSAPGVLGNDTDPDGDTLTVSWWSSASHGQFLLSNDGSFVYTPNAGFTGTDSFSYTVSDGQATDGPISVTITVNGSIGGNHPPQGSADSYSVNAGQTLTINAPGVLGNDTDADGDPLSAALTGTPSNGSASLNSDGSFTYTPNSGFTGTDSFTYTVSDGQATDGPITVTITVNGSIGGNHPPQGSADSYSVNAGQTLTVSAPGVLGNDTDPDGDSLSVASSTSASHGTASVSADGSFTYTPDAGFIGTDTFTYYVTDGQATDGPITVTITVSGSIGGNHPPVPTGDSYTVAHDHTLTVDAASGVLGNDMDPDGDPLTVTKINGLVINVGTGNGISTAHGTAYMNADGSFQFTPNAGYVGGDSFSYAVSDGIAESQASVTLQVTNGAPIANGDSYSTLHDQPLVITAAGVLANDYDPDGDALTTSLVSGPAHAASFNLNSDGSFSYTPASHWVGIDQFTYGASDGTTATNATVSITVSNSAPTLTLDEPDITPLGDMLTLTGSFSDPENPTYDGPYTQTINWGDGTDPEQHIFAAPDSFSWDHDYTQAGLYTISVQIQDIAGAAVVGQVPAAIVVVQTVEWLGSEASPLDANPGNGTDGTAVGLRIFPDKINGTDTVNRYYIGLRATIFPAVPHATVFCAAVDVDDPSSNSAPVDRETDAAGNEIGDNRGSGSINGGGAIGVETDQNGVAVFTFTVSMQPGDNWRAVSSCRYVDIVGIRGKQDDAAQLRVVKTNGDFLPTATAKVSEVLTVWRRLTCRG